MAATMANATNNAAAAPAGNAIETAHEDMIVSPPPSRSHRVPGTAEMLIQCVTDLSTMRNSITTGNDSRRVPLIGRFGCSMSLMEKQAVKALS